MSNIFIRTVFLLSATLFITGSSQAQENRYGLGLSYTAEVQFDFERKVNGVNLLSLEGRYRLWANGELSLQTISVWKTRREHIINDLQTFSNIEEDNMALNVFLGGYTHCFRNMEISGGIRNVNNDFFIGDYTSLFTNSSCGIYPTLSINFPIANYPLSAMCLHGKFRLSKALAIKNSLYNGVARRLFSGDGSLFKINLKKEGVLNVTELNYSSDSNNHGLYTIGSVLYTGNSVYADVGQESAETEEKAKVNYALWGSIEKSIYDNGDNGIGVLLQGSFAPSDRNDCKMYYGAGIVLNSIIPIKNVNTLGLFCNRAVFRKTTESTVEVTWKFNVNNNLAFQPAFHCIKTGSITEIVGLIRLCYCM